MTRGNIIRVLPVIQTAVLAKEGVSLLANDRGVGTHLGLTSYRLKDAPQSSLGLSASGRIERAPSSIGVLGDHSQEVPFEQVLFARQPAKPPFRIFRMMRCEAQ
jgi:hypothetical protein